MRKYAFLCYFRFRIFVKVQLKVIIVETRNVRRISLYQHFLDVATWNNFQNIFAFFGIVYSYLKLSSCLILIFWFYINDRKFDQSLSYKVFVALNKRQNSVSTIFFILLKLNCFVENFKNHFAYYFLIYVDKICFNLSEHFATDLRAESLFVSNDLSLLV